MCLAAPNRPKIHNNLYFGVQGHPRSFGGNRELVYDFLLVINGNQGFISHCY